MSLLPLIKKRFTYKDGVLYWLEPPPKAKAVAGMVAAGNINKKDGYSLIYFDGNRTCKHRIVWMLHYGEIPKGMIVDHKNRIRSDDRIENLRIGKHYMNSANADFNHDSKSGVRGVYELRGKWVGRIHVNSKRYRDVFTTKEQAEEAVKRTSVYLTGEFSIYYGDAPPRLMLTQMNKRKQVGYNGNVYKGATEAANAASVSLPTVFYHLSGRIKGSPKFHYID